MIRKRTQIDALNEFPKDKRPPEFMIWDGYSEDIEEWIDTVVDKKEQQTVDILLKDIE